MEEVFTLLEGLEVVPPRVAALRMSPEETDDLEALIGEMDVAIEGRITSAGGSSTRGCTYP